MALKTQTITVNLGPQHPSTHGVLRIIIQVDGERVVDVEPVIGYLHRGMEKMAEARTYVQNIPLTDRMDYVAAMSNNLAYVLAIEQLMDIVPTERAEYIRVIMAEFTRIQSHMVATGALLNDLGAFFTPMMYCLEGRERIVDLFEMASGSRMTCNYMRPGGVRYDLSDRFLPRAQEVVAWLPGFIDELEQLLTDNEILRMRCIGVGVLPPDVAVNYGVSGPMARASGVNYDVRRAQPYSIYNRFDFEIPVTYNGDTYDRYLLRVREMRQSTRILEQALHDIPDGEYMAEVPRPRVLRPPVGEAYSRIEGPKGELGFYLVSDGGISPYRFHVRPPTFINLSCLKEIAVGWKIADVVVILGSVDIVLGEIDR